jgi:hypothetical protein
MNGRRVAALTALLVASLAIASPSLAVSWGTLTAYHDSASSGQAQAQGRGDYYNSGNTYAKNTSYQLDKKPGGDSVYVETTHFFWYAQSGSSAAFNQWGPQDKTTRTSVGEWRKYTVSQELHPSGSRARGRSQVCEDQNNAPDDCSANAYPTFNY